MIHQNENMQRSIIIFACLGKGFWTYVALLRVWNPLDTCGFLRKYKIRMMKLLDTKYGWLLKFFTKPSIYLWKNIFTSIGCNNIAIFDYPSCI